MCLIIYSANGMNEAGAALTDGILAISKVHIFTKKKSEFTSNFLDYTWIFNIYWRNSTASLIKW